MRRRNGLREVRAAGRAGDLRLLGGHAPLAADRRSGRVEVAFGPFLDGDHVEAARMCSDRALSIVRIDSIAPCESNDRTPWVELGQARMEPLHRIFKRRRVVDAGDIVARKPDTHSVSAGRSEAGLVEGAVDMLLHTGSEEQAPLDDRLRVVDHAGEIARGGHERSPHHLTKGVPQRTPLRILYRVEACARAIPAPHVADEDKAAGHRTALPVRLEVRKVHQKVSALAGEAVSVSELGASSECADLDEGSELCPRSGYATVSEPPVSHRVSCSDMAQDACAQPIL